LIREGRSNQLGNVMLTGTQEGMITLEYSLASLIYDQIVTYEDAMAVTAHPKDLVRSIEQVEIQRSRI
jgi:twitching motility protein PilT